MSRNHPVSQIQHSLSALHLPEKRLSLRTHQTHHKLSLLLLIFRTSRLPQVWVKQVLLLLEVVPSHDNSALLLGAGGHHQAHTVQGVAWGRNHCNSTARVQFEALRFQLPEFFGMLLSKQLTCIHPCDGLHVP